MRTIMMGLVLAATLNGCATVGGVGVNTSNHGIWYQDCGVSRQIPGATATFKGTLTSPNSAVATDDQQHAILTEDVNTLSKTCLGVTEGRVLGAETFTKVCV